MRVDAVKHRQRLIEAAATVFARQGPDAPLQAVLAEAGLGRGTLYRHFADRAALLEAVYSHETAIVAAWIAERPDDPGLFRDFLHQHALKAAVHMPVVHLLTADQLDRIVARISDQVEAVFDAVIAQAKRHGVVRDSFDRAELRLVSHMLVGAANGCTAPPEQAVAEAIDIVLKGLRPAG